MKKLIPSAKIFLSYPSNKWEDIEILTQAELDSYEDVELIRKAGDYKVYYLENGAKGLIPSKKIFNSHKFK